MQHRIDARALAVLLCLLPATSRAQWAANGVGVTTAATAPATHTACPDGSGGIIVAWSEIRNGAHDILARRIAASGVALWNTDGIVVCAAAFDQLTPSICADGAGGAIIAWRDQRSGAFDIYAQRVDPHGGAVWADGGVGVCTVTNNQYGPVLVSDGAEGAIVAWYDFRALSYDIYVQRVDANGALLWANGGTAIYAAQLNQYNPVIVTDGAGGAVVAWSDIRNGNADIFARKITAAGAVQWASTGVALCTEVHDQLDAVLVPDGAGGIIAAWRDGRNGAWDVFAQRVASAGAVQWTANGVAVCNAANDQLHPAIACDGSGGAVVAWDDIRGASADVYAQRLNASGAAQWTANGVVVAAAPAAQSWPSLVCNGGPEVIVAWEDRRNANADVYTQRVSGTGSMLWAANGAAVCTAAGDQTLPLAVADGDGGAAMVWKDARSGSLDLYAQRVSDTGGTPTGVGVPLLAPALVVSPGHPNPFSRAVRFEVAAGAADAVALEVFDVAGHRVARRQSRGATVVFDGRDDRGRVLPAGVYICRFHAGGAMAARKVVMTR